MVRKLIFKPFKRECPLLGLLSIAALAVLASCNPTELEPSANTGRIVYDSSYANRAFVYQESPAILAGPGYGTVNIEDFLDKSFPEFITAQNQLKGDCNITLGVTSLTESECIHSYGAKGVLEQIPPRQADGTWIFPSGSKEFYQVNALFHLEKGVNKFFEKLSYAYKKLHSSTSTAVPKSIPLYLRNSNLWWFKGVESDNSLVFKNDFLTSYAMCDLPNNSLFSPVGPELCFGSDPAHANFHFIQDPSVIYHELGHAFTSIMMNLRNGTSSNSYTTFRSNLNVFGYDEAAAIGEGLADYFSYVMNGRTHVGEWGMGRYENQSRPLSERDPAHISGIDTTSEGRLSYPQYLLYDPNNPDEPIEDVHYAGQITSHYLVALTETLASECSAETNMTAQETATSYTMMILAETLSELGDLRSVGLDYPSSYVPYNPAAGPYFNNFNPSASYTWAHLVNPPTYRKFYQIFARNLKKYITYPTGFCTGFTNTESERLLDDYGLLLFKTYNDNGNSTTNKTYYHNTANATYPLKSLTNVNEANRRKSTLIAKDLLSLAEVSVPLNRVTYYIIDNASTMQGFLSNLLFKGIATTISSSVAGVNYNNDNIKLSPGEIVAVVPNLYNASNSPMAGVQVLANDWDHMDYDPTTGYFKPCVVDSKTTVDQGAIPPLVTNTCYTTMTSYSRYVKNINTNLYPTVEAVQPVCMVEMNDGVASRWVSQNEFRNKQGLSLLPKDCLGYSSNGPNADEDFSFNPNECLVRVLPGANDAFFSRIDAQKTYSETIRLGQTTNPLNAGNGFVVEINKWVPPATKFRCRLRARFSNCSDCYTDPEAAHVGDDFIDASFNGHKPFKVLNFDFTVND